jgi:predicted Zn-dependent protease
MTITSITEGSAAEKVGLQPGDIIVSINDVLVGTTEKEIKSFRKRYKDIKYKLTDATVKIKRDGLSRNFRFKPDRVCDYPASYYNSDNVNAYADGSKIMISRGMMRFIEDDNELALILSHELAHNAMNHMDAKNANAIPGIMLDMLSAYVGVQTYGMYGDATRNMFSQAFETEADYIALYFLYRAQFDIDNSANFWRRMSAENPGSIKQNHNSTHPSTPERYLRIEKTIEEIYAKEKNGEAVKPNAVIPNTGPRKGAWDKKGSSWD